MSTLNICLSDLGVIQSISYNRYKDLKIAWDTFRTVEIYNSNISTQRGEGNKTLMYHQFPSNNSQIEYKKGAFLFDTYLGYSNIVEKN